MDIGIKIKQLRVALHLTQEELADRCTLSKGYISQIENDLTSPSITTLQDILSGLGSDLHEFFSDNIDKRIVFSSEDFIQKETEEGKMTWLIPNSQKNTMEPILFEIAPNSTTSFDIPHEGEEFGYVLSGEIHLHLNKKIYFIKSGEAFYYEANKQHFLENRTNKVAKIIWVTSPPNF